MSVWWTKMQGEDTNERNVDAVKGILMCQMEISCSHVVEQQTNSGSD